MQCEGSFAPEAGDEEKEDGEDFKTACKHQKGENPFPGRSYHGVGAPLRRKDAVERGIAYTGIGGEAGVFQRSAADCQKEPSYQDYTRIDGQKDHRLVHQVGRDDFMVDLNGHYMIGINTPRKFVAGVFAEKQYAI